MASRYCDYAGLISRTERTYGARASLRRAGHCVLKNLAAKRGEGLGQPPRFSARSAVIRNTSLLPLARILYLYLDDKARDFGYVDLPRWVMAEEIGTTTRNIGRLIDALSGAGMLRTGRGSDRNRYVLSYLENGPVCPIYKGRGRPVDRTHRSVYSPALNIKVLQDTRDSLRFASQSPYDPERDGAFEDSGASGRLAAPQAKTA